MQLKGKILSIMFTLTIALWTCPVLADESSEELAQGRRISEPLDQEDVVSIPVRMSFDITARTLRTGDTRIIEDLQQLKDLFAEQGERDINLSAEELAKAIDFSRDVVVVVVGQPTETCKYVGISSLERIHKDHIRVTVVESFPPKPCTQPEKKHGRYGAIGTVVERPVKTVETVYAPHIQGQPAY